MKSAFLRPFLGLFWMLGLVAGGQIQAAPPANDHFVNRITLSGDLPIVVNATNAEASRETGEVDHAGMTPVRSVWWTWTPTVTGTYTVKTVGSSYDTVLGIYTGNAVNSLTEVNSDDQSGGSNTSLVEVDLTAGIAYHIAVDGYLGAEGDIVLTIEGEAEVTNDNFADRAELTGTYPITVLSSNTRATREVDEPYHAGVEGGGSLWWTWTPTTSGIYIIDTRGSSFDTVLAVYTGNNLTSLHDVAEDDDSGGNGTSLITFTATSNVTYQIAVDGYGTSTGDVTLTVAMLEEVPDNDHFADRALLGNTLPVDVVGNNVSATKQPGEPNHALDAGGKSIWWSWTAPASGSCTVRTTGSNFDTLLAVYTGTAVHELTEIASDDQSGGSNTSALTFEAVGGTTYQIAVDGWSGHSGQVRLRIDMDGGAPLNDQFADRILLCGCYPVIASASSSGATKEVGEPNHAGNDGGKSIWWTWTPTATGQYTINTIGSGFDTLLAIYTGDEVNGLTLVAEDDESGGAGASRVVFDAQEGVAYHIAVDGYNGQSGPVTLTLDEAAERPLNDELADAIALGSGPVTVTASTAGATVVMEEPFALFGPGGRSIWYTWTAPVTGEATLKISASPYESLLGVFVGDVFEGLLPAFMASSAFPPRPMPIVKETVYYIALYSFTDPSDITLTISDLVPAPANDMFADRVVVSPAGGTVTGNNRGAYYEEHEPDHNGMGGRSSVWWSWTPTVSGRYEINTDGSEVRTALGVYTGSVVSELTEVVSSGPSSTGFTTRVVFQATAGTTYQIAVSEAWYGPGFNEILSGAITLNIGAAPPAPANQHFSAAATVSNLGLPVLVHGSNEGALTVVEVDEPDIFDGEPPMRINGSSVWWKWTAPAGATSLRVSTAGSDFDTVVHVYTGSALNALTLVASNNDFYNGATTSMLAEVGLNVTPGTQYYIAVNGYKGGQGSITLNLMLDETPSNDAFADAILLSSSLPVSTLGWIDFTCGNEPFEKDVYVDDDTFWPSAKTVWWKWVAPSTGIFEVSTAGSSLNSVLQVYQGSTLANLTQVTESRDAARDGTSRLALFATNGQTYYFRVRGQVQDSLTGIVSLSVSNYGTAVTAADYVKLGRAYLELQTDIGLASADNAFAQALALDANHQEANLLKAITAFAMLEQTVAFQNVLTSLGVLDASLYGMEYAFPKNGAGQTVAAPGSNTSSAVAYLTTQVLPALPNLRAMLDKTNASFTTSLSDTESTSRFLEIDAGDVGVMRTASYALEALIRFVQTFEVGASVETVVEDLRNDEFNLEKALGTFTNVLNATGNDQRTAFKTALQGANASYQAASNFIRTQRSSNGEHSLFFLPQGDLEREAEVRARMQEVSNALDGSTQVGGESVDLSRFVGSGKSLREQVPGLVRNKAVSGTAPDVTFDGVVPGASQAKVSGFLRKHGFLHEVSTFGNWAQHFLKNQSPGNQAKDADPDLDMLNNFGEFAFNLRPDAASTPGQYQVSSLQTHVADGKKYLHISYPRRIVRSTISYVVAVSDDLVTWDRTQTQVQQVGSAVPSADGETEVVTFRVLADPDLTSRKFVRVEVTDLEP